MARAAKLLQSATMSTSTLIDEITLGPLTAAQRSDIITQFLAEAMLLASLGGVIGVLVGVGLGSLKSATMHPIVSPGSVVMSFGVSVLIGIFFGAYPASRAAALTPMEALSAAGEQQADC